MNPRNAILSLLVFCFVSGSARSQSRPELDLLFTGYLLGYYRIPDIQEGDFQQKCGDTYSAPTAWLLTRLDATHRPNSLLVGMGPNFAVELGSRVWSDGKIAGPDNPDFPGSLHPKTRNPGAGPARDGWKRTISDSIGDNVGCFLSRAHYDAIVPGKEDFYFGPERLRRIAHRLGAVPKKPNPGSNDLVPVRMLAANLVVKTEYWDKPEKVPDSLKSLGFKTTLPNDVEVVEISDGGTVLPFMRKITLGWKGEHPPEPYICPAGESDPDLVACGDHEIPLALGHTKLDGPKTRGEFSLPPGRSLDPGQNYGLCMKSPLSCLRFTVAMPFLLSHQCDTTEECVRKRKYETPYFISGDAQAVVLGVVDPDLPNLIGRSNLSWKNKEEDYRTEVSAMDPVESLRAAIQMLEQDPEYKPGMREILLAQMNSAKAKELAAHFPDFDVVIAAPTSHDRATPIGDMEMARDPVSYESSIREVGESGYRPLVITPWNGYDKDNQGLVDPLRRLYLSDNLECNRRAAKLTRPYVKYPDSETYQNRSRSDVLRLLANKWRPQLDCGNEKDNCAIDVAFQVAVLKILRDKIRSDTAMLQQRDFYFGPFHSFSNTPQEDIERIIWKGDRVRRVTVTGAILKKVLSKSAQFDQEDRSGTAEPNEQGRRLLVYGIQRTDDDNYLVRGSLLDESQLYTIATTAHIAAGDTGYPELNDAALMNEHLPQPPDQGTDGRRISELVCEKLLGNSENCIKDEKTLGGDGDVLFAASNDKPPTNPPTASQKLKKWAFGWLQAPVISGNNQTETAVQNRVINRFSVKELGFNMKWSTNNLSEADRAALLGGINEPGVDGANSHSWEFTNRVEWVRGGKWLDQYVRSQIEYSSQVTERSDSSNPAISRNKNRAQMDAGLFFHPATFCWPSLLCWNTRKSYPKIGLVLEPFSRFDAPLAKTTVDISPPSPAAPEPLLDLDRTWRHFSRAGIRLETSNIHFEMGFQGGIEHGHLESIQAPGNAPCFPSPTESLQECLKRFARPLDHANIQQIRTSRSRRGFYLDQDWTIPLSRIFKYQILSQIEWYPFAASDDNTTDTRYRYDITQKFSILIWPNLSFSPGVQLFVYRNDFGSRQLLRWSPTASLTFAFDRYSGGNWRKSIKYGSGAAPAK